MPTTLKIAPRDLGKYEAQLAKQFRPTLAKALLQASKFSLTHIRLVSAATVQNYKGRYNRGWRSRMRGWGAVDIYNAARHADYVENGRRPGAKQPPLDVMERWVRDKIGVPPSRDKQGRFSSAPYRAVAFLIARAIARRGIHGKFVMARSLPVVMGIFDKTILGAFDRVLRSPK